MRRVSKVVAELGIETPHASITAGEIERAVEALAPSSDAEKKYLLRDVKRFFKFLSSSRESNGLGLVNFCGIDQGWIAEEERNR